MAIAQEIVAGNADVGIVVVRVLLEDDATDPAFKASGPGLSFYGGESAAAHRQARSGDHLFIGSADRNAEGAEVTIDARPPPGRDDRAAAQARRGNPIWRRDGPGR